MVLKPDQTRVLLRPFSPGDSQRVGRIIARIMSLPEKRVGPLLDEISADFSQRHQHLHRRFMERFEQVREEYVPEKEEKSEEKSNDSKEVSFKISADFWNPDVQKMMTVTVRDQRKDILGKTCVAHDFIQKITEKEHIKGTAWIEENTGIPVEVQFTQKPLPKHVKKMISTIRYQYIS